MKLIVKIISPHEVIAEFDCPNDVLSKDRSHPDYNENPDLLCVLSGEIETFLRQKLADPFSELLESVSFKPKARYNLAEAYNECELF